MTVTLPEGRMREMAPLEVQEMSQSLRAVRASVVQTLAESSDEPGHPFLWNSWKRSNDGSSTFFAGSEILHDPASESRSGAAARFIGSSEETPVSAGDDEEGTYARRTFVLHEKSNLRNAQVFRFGLGSDFLTHLSDGYYVGSGRHLVEQNFADIGDGRVVSWRLLESQTLDDQILSLDSEKPSSQAFRKRFLILERILAGLEELSGKRQIHGDLRPTNIALRKTGDVRLLDYASRPTLSILNLEQRTYLAPEARSQPSSASDVYSFGRIAQRLIGNHLWNDSYTPKDVDRSSFAWILEICTQTDPSVRPTLAHLRDALFGRDGSRESDGIASSRQLVPDRNFLHSLASQLETVNSRQTSGIASALARFPETSLSVRHPHVQRDLHSVCDLDTFSRPAHNLAQEVPQEGRSRDDIEHNPHDFPKQIDEQMKDGIHRLHFGIGLSPSHDENMPRIRRRSKLAARQADYHAHLRRADAARNRLLASDQYLYSSDVAGVLGLSNDDTSLATVATMRRWGALLAVRDHERWLHPKFQFDPHAGTISPFIADANRAMTESDSWETLSWWFFPRISLGGVALASVLHDPGHGDAVRSAIKRFDS